jgi:hypothetical protein
MSSLRSNRAGVAAVADRQRSAEDGGLADVGVFAGEEQRSGAGRVQLLHGTGTLDRAGVGDDVVAVEGHHAVGDDRLARDAAEARAGAAPERTCQHESRARVRVRTRKLQRTAAGLCERAHALDVAGVCDRARAVELHGGAAGDEHAARAADRADRSAAADLQHADRDGGRTGVGVVAGEGERRAADDFDRAVAADHAAVSRGVDPVEDEHARVGDVAGERTECAAVADLQNAGGDRGDARVGLVGGEDQAAGSDLLQAAGTAHNAAVGDDVGAVEVERGGGRRDDALRGDRAEHAAVADLDDAG